MSDIVFPMQLPGAQIDLQREPLYATDIQTASSGSELRASWQSYPRYKYSLTIEFARSDAIYAEFQRLMTGFSQALGQYDSFLIVDPEDSVLTGQGFGLGDGSKLGFQLQRTLGGLRQVGTWDPTLYAVYTTARTNLLVQSQDFTQAAWVKETGATVTGPVLGPDGLLSAQTLSTTTGGNGTFQTTAKNSANGTADSLSVWLKAGSVSTAQLAVNRAGGLDTESTTVNLTSTWQRFSFGHSATWSGATALQGIVRPTSVGSILVYGAQLEAGAASTQYIPTTASAVTASPAYWPAFGDGFEPITVYNPSTLQVSVDGVLKTPYTDYAMLSAGSIQMTSAPINGASLTASVAYFRRVRFADGSLPLKRIFQRMWEGKAVNLISIK